MFQVLLYYYYTFIDNKEQYLEKHKDFCAEIDVKGRIIISSEGLNGTISGSKENCKKYMDFIREDNRFKNIQFKIDDCKKHLFPKMSIKLRPEIVSLKVDNLEPDKKTGVHLSPSEFKNMMLQEKDAIILDVRSNYEHSMGKFKNAHTFDIDNFRELPEKIKDSNLLNNKEKKIMTYCTGGIKCEKASALLLKYGFKNVYQLNGGIINYSQKEDGFNFDGECYVFDSRQSIPVNNVNPCIITKCYICDDASTDITNCRYTICNRQTVICKKCSIKFDGFCCIECKNMGYSSEKLRYVPFN